MRREQVLVVLLSAVTTTVVACASSSQGGTRSHPETAAPFVCADSLRARAEGAEINAAANRFKEAATLWAEAAAECLLEGDVNVAGMLFLRSSRAYRVAGDLNSAIEVLNQALLVAHQTPASGVGFDPTGAQQEVARRHREARVALRQDAAAEAAALELLLGAGADVKVVVKTNPQKQTIRYWSLSEGAQAAQTLTTNDSVMVKGQRFYFLRQRPGGVTDTIVRQCNKGCNITFP